MAVEFLERVVLLYNGSMEARKPGARGSDHLVASKANCRWLFTL